MQNSFKRLNKAINQFLKIRVDDDYQTSFHTVYSAMMHISSILETINGHDNREQILEVMQPFRKQLSLSPLCKRLQEWPRGYAGDFETIEYLLNGKNRCTANSFEYYIEEFSLKCGAAQQHRNKVQAQAQLILNTCLNSGKNGPVKILSLGSGSCPDLQRIQELIAHLPVEFTLLDSDPDAIAFSKKKLNLLQNQCHFIQGNIVKEIRHLTREKYDLIVTSGLFDYIPDRVYTFLVNTLFNKCLKPGGKLFLTNINNQHPFKMIMEYYINWSLLDRNEATLYSLLQQSGLSLDQIHMEKDPTDVTYLIEITSSPHAVREEQEKETVLNGIFQHTMV